MTQTSPIFAKFEPQTEPWLRGTLAELPAEQRAVLHALELAREDCRLWCEPLREEELHARPYNLPSVAFHLRHITGSLDRLLTYAEGNLLSEKQKQEISAEMDAPVHKNQLLEEFERGLAAAESRVRSIKREYWPEPRGVGKKQLPTSVAGLLIHCAEHTQRHVGQAITTAKVVTALRENPAQ